MVWKDNPEPRIPNLTSINSPIPQSSSPADTSKYPNAPSASLSTQPISSRHAAARTPPAHLPSLFDELDGINAADRVLNTASLCRPFCRRKPDPRLETRGQDTAIVEIKLPLAVAGNTIQGATELWRYSGVDMLIAVVGFWGFCALTESSYSGRLASFISTFSLNSPLGNNTKAT